MTLNDGLIACGEPREIMRDDQHTAGSLTVSRRGRLGYRLVNQEQRRQTKIEAFVIYAFA